MCTCRAARRTDALAARLHPPYSDGHAVSQAPHYAAQPGRTPRMAAANSPATKSNLSEKSGTKHETLRAALGVDQWTSAKLRVMNPQSSIISPQINLKIAQKVQQQHKKSGSSKPFLHYGTYPCDELLELQLAVHFDFVLPRELVVALDCTFATLEQFPLQSQAICSETISRTHNRRSRWCRKLTIAERITSNVDLRSLTQRLSLSRHRPPGA